MIARLFFFFTLLPIFQKTALMPIYMDLHIVPGVNAKDVAQAHSMDVLMEKEHSCKCLTYWIDEVRGHVFCLIDAPSKESVTELHARAHGLVPNKIIEVESSLVQAFLGRITDPENAALTDNGLIIMDDTSYRILMHLQIMDPVLLQQTAGAEKAAQILQIFKKQIKEQIIQQNGRVVTAEADELIASFIEGNKALSAAYEIMQQLQDYPEAALRISIHAGEPVTQSDKLFGDTIQLLKRMNSFQREQTITMTSGIRELLDPELLQKEPNSIRFCSPKEEAFISALFDLLETKYTDEHFNMDECCRHMAMSQSQLYRKTTDLFQTSPNNLLRNYRLLRALEQLSVQNSNVSQVSFDTGFASASYFTKCFKSCFGLLPLAYREAAIGKKIA